MAKSSKQLDREIDEAVYKFRVTVRVEGAPKPVWTSSWMPTKEQANRLAAAYRDTVRNRGWTHKVEIERILK
jgi:hypothetical protein